jgi:hypothetical protein
MSFCSLHLHHSLYHSRRQSPALPSRCFCFCFLKQRWRENELRQILGHVGRVAFCSNSLRWFCILTLNIVFFGHCYRKTVREILFKFIKKKPVTSLSINKYLFTGSNFSMMLKFYSWTSAIELEKFSFGESALIKKLCVAQNRLLIQ